MLLLSVLGPRILLRSGHRTHLLAPNLVGSVVRLVRFIAHVAHPCGVTMLQGYGASNTGCGCLDRRLFGRRRRERSAAAQQRRADAPARCGRRAACRCGPRRAWSQLRAPAAAAQQLGEASRRSRCADAAIHPCSLLVAAAATAGPPASVLLMGSQRAHRGKLQVTLLYCSWASLRCDGVQGTTCARPARNQTMQIDFVHGQPSWQCTKWGPRARI